MLLCSIGVLPELVGLLAPSFSMSERLEAAHALSSITSGSAAVASTVVELGAVAQLVALLSCPELAAQTAGAVCLAELAGQAGEEVTLCSHCVDWCMTARADSFMLSKSGFGIPGILVLPR